MNIKLILIALLIIVGCGFFLLKTNNGGKTMTEAGVNNNHKVLVAYFSRTGELYSVGSITEGNTAIIAKMKANKTGGDLFEIKVAQDNYPSMYTELTEYAQQEKRNNARPEIVGKVENFADYDTIFIGYPNWWGDMPMPVYTFLESYDFTNKNVIPFCTHEGSGLGSTQNKVQNAAKGGKLLNGFAIYGHTAQNDRTEADKKVSEWLKGIGF